MSNETILKVKDTETVAEGRINQASRAAEEIIKNAKAEAEGILNQAINHAKSLRQSRINDAIKRGNELKSNYEKAADIEKTRLLQIAKERQADLILKITDSLI